MFQDGGARATLNGNNLTFTLDGQSVNTTINGSQYNFYSLVYSDGSDGYDPYLEILQNGHGIENETLSKALSFNTLNDMAIGGSGIKGNIHDIRLWTKVKTAASAAEEKDFTLSGKEFYLLGYWPLDEGHGLYAADKARNRNAQLTANWTIKPVNEAYAFNGVII